MQLVTDTERWCAVDDGRALASWIADRAAAVDRHLPPLVAVGRTPDGRLGVDVLRPAGLPLAEALDVLGVPTTGVAVTLTVPLLELARAECSGAVVLGDAHLDDVLVDDAGAVVLCDRPPGAVLLPASASPSDALPLPAPARPTAGHTGRRTLRGTDPPAVRGSAPGSLGTSPSAVRRADVHPAGRTLVLAARLVWERVDPRDPVRPDVDRVLAAALGPDADATALDAAVVAVRAAAAPRPVRWDPPPADVLAFVSTPPDGRPAGSVDAILRDLVEHGIPLGSGRRIGLRPALVGAVVAVGSVGAALLSR